MAISFVNKGTFQSNNGAITCPMPANITAGDFLLLVCETANEALSTPNDWTPVPNSPQGTGTAAAAGSIRLTCFYRIATGSNPSVTVGAAGLNHLTGIVLAYRDVDTADPFHLTPWGGTQGADTAMSWTSVTTTIANVRVILAAAVDTDANSQATVTGYTNAALSDIQERHDQSVNTGTGGGVAIADGLKASAGSVGTTTATGSTSVTHAYLLITLKPVAYAKAATDDAGTAGDSGTTTHTSAQVATDDAGTAGDSGVSEKQWSFEGTGTTAPLALGFLLYLIVAEQDYATDNAGTAGDSAVCYLISTADNAGTAADSATLQGTFGHVATDGPTAGDSALYDAWASDGAAAGDTGTTTGTFAHVATDDVGAGDSGIGSLGDMERDATDGVAAGDSAAVVGTFAHAATDAAGTAGDSAISAAAIGADIGGTTAPLALGFGLSTPVAQTYTRDATDGATATDSAVSIAAGSAGADVALTAPLALGFALTNVYVPHSYTLAVETTAFYLRVAPADIEAEVSALPTSFALTTVPVTFNVSLRRGASDPAAATDSGATQLTSPRSATDTAAAGDTAPNQLTAQKAATDSATAADSGLGPATFQRGATDQAGAGDSAISVAGGSSTRAASDNAGAADGTATVRGTFNHDATEDVASGDAAATRSVVSAIATDSAEVGDSADESSSGTIDAFETAQAGDAATTEATLGIDASDGAAAGDSAVAVIQSSDLFATDNVAAQDALLAVSRLIAEAIQAINADDAASQMTADAILSAYRRLVIGPESRTLIVVPEHRTIVCELQ